MSGHPATCLVTGGYRPADRNGRPRMAAEKKGRHPAALSRTEPRARLEDAVRRRQIEEVEQVIQCRRVHRRVGARRLHRVREIVPAAVRHRRQARW